MKDKGIGTAAIVLIVVVVAAAAAAGGYMVGSTVGEKTENVESTGDGTGGGESPEVNGNVNFTMSPEQLSVDDNYSIQITVTNNESGEMTIYGAAVAIFKDNWLGQAAALTKSNLKTTSVSPGETKTVLSDSYTLARGAGNWKYDLFLFTNYGKLEDSATLNVTE